MTTHRIKSALSAYTMKISIIFGHTCIYYSKALLFRLYRLTKKSSKITIATKTFLCEDTHTNVKKSSLRADVDMQEYRIGGGGDTLQTALKIPPAKSPGKPGRIFA